MLIILGRVGSRLGTVVRALRALVCLQPVKPQCAKSPSIRIIGPGPPGLDEAPEKKIPAFGKLTQNFFPVRLLAAAAAGGRTANGR
jgi:hypothetical protein